MKKITKRKSESTRKNQLHDLLMNKEDSIPIEEAILNSKKKNFGESGF